MKLTPLKLFKLPEVFTFHPSMYFTEQIRNEDYIKLNVLTFIQNLFLYVWWENEM